MKSLGSELGFGRTYSIISLNIGDSVDLPDPVGYRISCISGSIWISCSEHGGTLQLHAGEQRLVQCGGCATLHAHSSAQIELIEETSVRLGLGRMPSPRIAFVRAAAGA